MAKKFFYVCAGLLLLSISYQLGARGAAAQSVAQFSVGGLVFGNTGTFSAGVADRTVYYTDTFPITTVNQIPQPLPGASPAVAVTRWGTQSQLQDHLIVLMANGDLYAWELGSWYLAGNLAGAVTPAQSATWGQLKDRYRR